MRYYVMTLFPDMIETVMSESILGRAQEAGHIELIVKNIRDYTLDKHTRVDDYPYGGGAGMVMEAEPYGAATKLSAANAGSCRE